MSKPERAVYRLKNSENPVAAESIVGIVVSWGEGGIVLVCAALTSKPQIPSSVFQREEPAQIFRTHANLTVGDSPEGP